MDYKEFAIKSRARFHEAVDQRNAALAEVSRLRADHAVMLGWLTHWTQRAQTAEAERDRLRDAAETAKSWIEIWAKHIDCRSDDTCTCGRTLALYELSSALTKEPK